MSALHPLLAQILTDAQRVPAVLAAATIYRPSANRLREFKTADEAQAYDLAAECYPADVVDLRPELLRAASQAWHDMDRRARLDAEARDEQLDERARRAGL